ncbi:hypothetical protein [Nocardia sp. NPDC020380]|uniref:hypothetical protein n=1 Tax=Nocardia sp. NPDC020380 TaxID=3364309 RepID=UPI0037B708BF
MHILIWIVTIAGVSGSVLMLIIGLVKDWTYGHRARRTAQDLLEAGERSVQTATDRLAEAGAGADADKTTQTLQAQSSVLDTMGSTLEGLAKLATALKDLDAGSRAYFLSVVFLVVAAATASVGQFA